MTVEFIYAPVRLAGNGILADFDGDFKIFSAADIKVYKVLNSTNVKTLQTLNTHYTVSINTVTEGFTVTFLGGFIPSTLQDVLMELDIELDQPTNLPYSTKDTQIENELDRKSLQILLVKNLTDRSPRMSIENDTDLSFDYTLPTPVAGEQRALLMDETGFSLSNTDMSDLDAALASAAASAAAASASASSAATSASTATTQAAAAAASAAAAAASAASVDATTITELRVLAIQQQFEILALNGLSVQNLIDAFTDTYNDATGIDATASLNETRDATNKLYINTAAAANRVFWCQANGANGSTTFTDEDAHAITNVSSAIVVSTAQSKFGGASALGVGGANGLEISADAGKFSPAANANWALSGFIRLVDRTSPAQQFFWTNNVATAANRSWLDYTHGATKLRFQIESSSGNYTCESNVTTLANNTTYHVAAIRVGNDVGLYLDGAQVGYVSVAGIASVNMGVMAWLSRDDNAASQGINGYMDDMAIFTGNIFGAAPVVGLTNTITVPATPVGVTVAGNLTLESVSVTADAQPVTGKIIFVTDENDQALTINTDLKGWVSRDGGTTFTQATLALESTMFGGIKLYSGDAALTGQPAGTSMRYRITSHNSKIAKILSGGLLWD